MTNDEILLSILKQIPIFADLDQENHQEIIKNINLQFFPKETVIFSKGTPGDALYIIKQGLVQIFKGEGTDIEELAQLKDSDFFGEMALISEEPRMASAKTVTDSDIFILKKEDFMKLIQSDPNMAGRISKEYIDREKENVRKYNI